MTTIIRKIQQVWGNNPKPIHDRFNVLPTHFDRQVSNRQVLELAPGFAAPRVSIKQTLHVANNRQGIEARP